jgi:RNA polymerase sigma-70 factor (ECF subfamily)
MGNLTDTKAKELTLFKQFKSGETGVFDYFFERYYQGLCVYALKLVGSEQVSKDLVQDFFLRFWENRKAIEIHSSVKSYFLQSIHNRCMDYLSFHQVRFSYRQNQLLLLSEDELAEYPLLHFELKQQIDAEINRLPEDIRLTFILNRFEGLSYQQIADQENISVKTVEYRISKALNYLRKALDDYLYSILL